MHSESENNSNSNQKAWLIIALNALYSIADSLCSVFVSVYLYTQSQDINTVLIHYLMIYIVTPVVFSFAGWYAKSRDRTHVFRIGLALHALYYASLLYLREDAAHYAAHLGALLGVTWGFFWVGNNTFQYDFSHQMRSREYFLGLVSTVNNGSRLIAPMISGLLISFAPTKHAGYQIIFTVALVVYIVASLLSFRIPHSEKGKPFRIKRALFPPKEDRDWRIIMIASASLAGSFQIFHFLLAIVMYSLENSEAQVGIYVSLQGLVSITTAFLVGRFVVPKTRSSFIFWGVVALILAGLIISWKISMITLIAFGFLRSISLPLVGIPHTGIRFDVMERTATTSDERIEYLCAWEVPLAVGRIVMMGTLLALYALFGEMGLRITILLLCFNRIITYLLLRQVSFVKDPELA